MILKICQKSWSQKTWSHKYWMAKFDENEKFAIIENFTQIWENQKLAAIWQNPPNKKWANEHRPNLRNDSNDDFLGKNFGQK